MYKIKITETIDLNLVRRLISKYPNQQLCLVIDNTKLQSPEKLEEVAKYYNDKITISVLGGLSPDKKKFNSEHYQKRTYHSPLELSKIIRVYQKIERGINLSWGETEKVMWVYNALCNQLQYSELQIDGKDVCRSLSGLLYGKAVCSGFALILKEALDRIGIKCIYQNASSFHSWVIAYLDGAYRSLELTWDCCNKGQNGCGFRFFNRLNTTDFYNQTGHGISREPEEREYPLTPYSVDQINGFVDRINKKRMRIPLSENRAVNLNSVGRLLEIRNGKVTFVNPNIKRFVRSDGSIFYLIYTGPYKSMNRFYYFEMRKDHIHGTSIYSESRLDLLPQESHSYIANGLLSQDRVKRKIEQFNGYVGYIGHNYGIYYDSIFERQELNVIR